MASLFQEGPHAGRKFCPLLQSTRVESRCVMSSHACCRLPARQRRRRRHQADLKTFSALGCYGMTPSPPSPRKTPAASRASMACRLTYSKAQIDAVVQDIGVDAVKIGMLHSPTWCAWWPIPSAPTSCPMWLLDPVMVATSGDRLIAQGDRGRAGGELFPLAEVITPNLDEAGWLLGRSLQDADALEAAAQVHPACAGRAGGVTQRRAFARRLGGGCAVYARCPESAQAPVAAHCPHNGHGTGCTLSSAIAAPWRWGCRCSRRWNKPAATSWAQLPPR